MTYAPPPFWTAPVATHAEYLGFQAFIGEELHRRWRYEATLQPAGRSEFDLAGYCGVCAQSTMFHVDDQYGFPLPNGGCAPNWRERLVCFHCGLNSRMRAALHLLSTCSGITERSRVYITEEVTSFFRSVKARHPLTVGSEYLQDGTPYGQRSAAGVLCQDITQLTFLDGELDCFLTFDVLEHVPDYPRAMSEMLRVLRPGGQLMLTVPFDLSASETVRRAYVDENGIVVHLLPPEYHGDPLNKGGVLAFYDYGWDFLDSLRHAGFEDVTCNFFWSEVYGYLGVIQFLITATKPSA